MLKTISVTTPTFKDMIQQTLDPKVLNFWMSKVNRVWSVNKAQAKIIAKKQSAQGSVTLILAPNSRVVFPQAGQHVTVTAEVNGTRISRSYSPSVLTDQPNALAITVKQVAGGKLSTWLCQQAKVGDVVELGQAFGDFAWPQAPQEVVLIAAGSGITPMISFLRQQGSLQQPVQLHYWVSKREQACFVDELIELQQQQANFSFHLYLTQQQPCQPYEQQGRIHADQFNHLTHLDQCHVLACGPAGFVAAAQQILHAQVASWQAEAFSPPVLHTELSNEVVNITLQKQQRVISVPVGQSILTALEAEGIAHPSGCRMGLCNSCACPKLSGTTQNLISNSTQQEGDSALRVCISSARTDLVLDI
jgi:ferredoxin-NADP reductase